MWCCAHSHIAMEPTHLFRANILCDQPYKSGENLQKSGFVLILYAADYLTTAQSANLIYKNSQQMPLRKLLPLESDKKILGEIPHLICLSS